MIYHYDKALNDHNHSGRDTAMAILGHCERQSFDVSISVSANWNDNYKKRYAAYLTMKNGRPVMVVLDSNTPKTKESFVNATTTSKELHEKAGYLARELYADFLKKFLLANGFQPHD